MKIQLNTIFSRALLMTTSLLVLSYAVSLFVFGREANSQHAEQDYRDLLVIEQARRDGLDATKRIATSLGIGYLEARDAPFDGAPISKGNTYGLFENALRNDLPVGSQVTRAGDTGAVWVRYAGDKNWFEIPDATFSAGRVRSALALMLALAIIIASIGTWDAQRRLRRLAKAAREFRLGVSAPVVSTSGPREVTELINDFNEMVRQINAHEQERAMMLAGVAHDLRTPLTRMLVRADLLPAGAERIGFLSDAESLGRIVTQFLDFVRDRSEGSPLISVDAYCERQYGSVAHHENEEDLLLKLNLQAGNKFRLPLVELDRILSNLLENAMNYGEPPVEIKTSLQDGNFILMLRDHGPGIIDDQLDRAVLPFVRLDAARGGDAHSGLGLAIVRRLVRRNDGAFSVTNAQGGGLQVLMVFPSHGV